MTPKSNTLYEQALCSVGLTIEQAHVYELILQKGARQAGQIPRALGISRPQAYKLLDELVQLGLVSRETPPGKPALFVVTHPFALQELARRRKEEADITALTVQGVMSSLISDYTASSKIPGIRILAGVDGLRELYADVLQERQPILLLRSVRDDDDPVLREIVLEQIHQQMKRGLQVRLLGPQPLDIAGEELKARDTERLTTRKILDRDAFSVPAQVLLYGNKIGITSYEQSLMTLIIENEAIQFTFRSMFELLWQGASEPL